MQTFHLPTILLALLFHLQTAVLALPQDLSSLLKIRADPPPPIPTASPSPPSAFTAPECLNYATIANLSVIGANSSYRAPFLQNSPQGTYTSAAILNNAIAQIPMLMMDVNLNNKCGNLTTVAKFFANDNFTKGIVAQFSGLPPPTGVFPNAMVILFLGIIYIIFMGVLFNSL